jgi:two-component system sensor histidine kinase BaeS
MLAVSLAVAACSIAATAWLTTRSTSSHLQNEISRTLETDNLIYQSLLKYAGANPSWDGVQADAVALAEQTGRRVTLATAAGLTMVDTAGVLTPGAKVPAGTPTAVVDPLTATDTVTGISLPPSARKGPGADLPAAAYYVSPAEQADRQARAIKEVACAAHYGVAATIVDGAYGGPAVQFTDKSTVTDKLFVACDDIGLSQPGARYVEVQNAISDQTAACLRAASVAFTESSDEVSGLRYVKPVKGDDASAQVEDSCFTVATHDALRPYVAPPALLYLGIDQPTPGLWARAGGIRITMALAAVLAVALLVTLLAGRRLVRPVRALTRAAQRMASGDRSTRVQAKGRDELARLGDAFNVMAESVEAYEQQRKVMVSDIAHELRNPLANVRGYLEGVGDGVVVLDMALVDSLLEESLLLQRLVDDLQDLALADAGRLRVHPEPLDAVELAEQVVSAKQPQALAGGVTLVVVAKEPAPVVADPARLRQALGNLVANALRYTPPGGSVAVRIDNDHTGVTVAVADTGTGIDPDHLPHLFDRFYRADSSRSRATGGSGLGLAIVRHLAEAHGGRVFVESTVGAGSTFTVWLPPSPISAATCTQDGHPAAEKQRVLAYGA